MAKKIVKAVSKKSKIVKKVVKVTKVVKAVKAPKAVVREVNPTHISKINRVIGQAGGVKRMVEEGKYCTEILTQLKAVRSAIKSLEAEILESHLQDGVAGLSFGSAAQKNKKIAEMKNIFVRFE